MDRTNNYNNTLENERIMFRNDEYLNLHNNTNKYTTKMHLLVLLHNFLDSILLSIVLVLHVSA